MKISEILGIEYPFIQGGMANIATGEFAAAVSNAGAFRTDSRRRYESRHAAQRNPEMPRPD